MTSSDKSVSNFLEARDRRQDSLAQYLSKGYPATIFLSLNIPGSEKTPPGSEALFHWMLGKLSEAFSGLVILEKATDILGPYAIMSIDMDPVAAKKLCIDLETRPPVARLVDLDVYSADAIQIDRGRLDFPPRRCLVCEQTAVECMRIKRHSADEVIGKAHELLTSFRT